MCSRISPSEFLTCQTLYKKIYIRFHIYTNMVIKTREELIKKYIDFFKSKHHKEIPSSSLIPENDPTVLFTTAGMHPLVPYLLGQKHPLGKKLVSVQKCLRTVDIEKVGNETHHTFFEMLGNWSLGDYWKKEAIEWSYEFLTKVLEINKDKLAFSVFKGNDQAKKDVESAERWKLLGVEESRIACLPKEDNWWELGGTSGPCGPDTEMFYWSGNDKIPYKFDSKDKRWVEIWNDVFMQYFKVSEGKYEELKQKNVDTGMGVERTVAVLNDLSDNYKTSIFQPIIKEIEFISGKPYEGNEKPMRIVADHLRASVFILGDSKEIKPANVGGGYILRRLIRRAIRYAKLLNIEENFTKKIAEVIVNNYKDYVELEQNSQFIFKQLNDEENRFSMTLEKGLKKLDEVIKNNDHVINGKDAFLLFQSYGFPIEMTAELAKEKNIQVDVKSFESEFLKHQELSRNSSAVTFKSGLADDSQTTIRLHTATHLLNEALRIVLGNEIKQKGSNITPERLRFDFNFPRKLTEEELKKIQDVVNEKIVQGLKVSREEHSLNEAIKLGAQAEFGMKYPDLVSVYTINDNNDKKKWFSKEICTGPHVKNTNEIGKFKIIKEEGVAAGVRRIKAIVE